MRIAFVTSEFITEQYFSGGLANYVYRVSKALVSMGHEIHVITLSTIDDGQLEQDGIHVHRVRNGRPRQWLNTVTRYRLPGTALWIDFSLQAYRILRQLHRKTPFDIVQFPDYHACGLFASVLLHVPYVVRISWYGPLWNELSGQNRNLDVRVRESLERIHLRWSRHIYAPSYRLQEILARETGITRIDVIRTPFYLETSAWDESLYDEHLKGKDYLLFFGRFELHKGFHVLAQALPRVLEAKRNCVVALVGLDTKTRIAPSMKAYALSLSRDYADRLVFMSQIPHAQLYPIINGARVVVLPSLIDNLPNSCLEAMALGKPVIGTHGASFDELITEGETGFLVPPDDVTALANKVIEVWTSPRLDEIGQAAQQKVQEYGPERTVRDLVDYYQSILNNNR